MRISRTILNASGVAQANVRVRVTALGGNSPIPFALADGGPLIKNGNTRTDASGVVTVFVTGNKGCRISAYSLTNDLIYQQDVNAVAARSQGAAEDNSDGALKPVSLQVGNTSEAISGTGSRVVQLLVVYNDGSVVRNPGSGVTAVSATPARATVVAGTRTITGVSTGTSNVTFTYTEGSHVVNAVVAVTVS